VTREKPRRQGERKIEEDYWRNRERKTWQRICQE
jgi:hypothetical protein